MRVHAQGKEAETVNHFYQDIPGYFTWPEFYRWLAQRVAREEMNSGIDGVEVGTCNGTSLAFLAVELVNMGCEFHLSGVDPDNANGNARRNLKRVEGRVNLVDYRSVDAATQFQDASLDFVFIDGDHSYESVRADIAAWLPKIRYSGIIAGHDFSPDFPGVVHAVTEAFDEFNVHRGEKFPGAAGLVPEARQYFPVWWKEVG